MKRLAYTLGAIAVWLLLMSPMLHCQTPSGVACRTFYLNGSWSPGTVYVSCTIVSRNGSSYVATVASYNSDPATSPTKWQLLAAAGTNGTNGKDGATGATGPQGPPWVPPPFLS